MMIQPPIGKGENSIFQSISLKDIRLGYTFYHIFSLFMFKKAIFFNVSSNEYMANYIAFLCILFIKIQVELFTNL